MPREMIAQEVPRGLMVECKEVGKPAEFENMNAGFPELAYSWRKVGNGVLKPIIL